MDRKIAMKVVAKARDQAWTHAERYWALEAMGDEKGKERLLYRLDIMAEKVGQALLVPTYAETVQK